MKEERVFRYEGSKESFSNIHGELASLGIRVIYNERRCSPTSIEGFLQHDSGSNTLCSILEEKGGSLREKGMIIEETVRRYTLDRNI